MKNYSKVILLFILLFKSFDIFCQPINYYYKDKTISKDYIISGKSKIKFSNSKYIVQQIKMNNAFVKFCAAYKDSLSTEIISSLIIFNVHEKKIINISMLNVDFQLNSIVNELIATVFKSIQLKKYPENDVLIGFYVHFIPKSKETNIEFVEFRDDKYYSIFRNTFKLN
ncbi:hypothetical protein [Flavobacterium sp. T12S277]|uniref:hypothetical protein n=1 Tax=Flavobacterium sp. T12S277 TaxID=3402752 RepID=UPI003AE5919D